VIETDSEEIGKQSFTAWICILEKYRNIGIYETLGNNGMVWENPVVFSIYVEFVQ
jgi:hypothetical protein